MKNINKILIIVFISVIYLRADYPEYNDYDISLYFEVTETAIDQFVKTQVFPHPVGTYTDGNDQYSYSISLIQPGVTITTGTVTFSSAIIGSVTLLGNTVKYTYPVTVPIDIPAEDITVNEINGFLENIPTAINNIPTGPQWLKNIIITAYTDLEISLYPDQFMEEINAQIPDDLDININDIEFGWEALEGKLQFHVTVPCESRGPFVELVNCWFSTNKLHVYFQFRSNVKLRILNYELYYSGYRTAHGSSSLIIPAPTEGQQVGETITLTFNKDDSEMFPSGTLYEFSIVFGTDQGWFEKNYPTFTIN